MKHALIIALLITAGCEESSGSGTPNKTEFILPSGTSIRCKDHRVWSNGVVTLVGCDSVLFAPSGNIKCASGVCWEHK